MDINIKDDGVYDIKEVSELTKIAIRNLQRIALRRNIEKAGRSYIFTGAQIKDLWLNTVSPPKDTAIPPSDAKPNAIARATAHEEVTHESFSYGQNAIEQDRIRIEEKELALNAFKELDKARLEIKELKEELSGYEITENERLEVFTNEEYAKFEERLTQWRLQSQHIITQQKDNEHQQELFNAKVLTLEQSEEHYKNSYFYQRKQNERFIDMHEKLLDTIQLSGKEGFIKSVVEAKKTDWDKEDLP